MPQTVIVATTAGLVSGMFSTALTSQTMVGFALSMFAMLPLFAVGLSLHLRAMAIAAATGTIIAAVVGGFGLSINYLGINALPALIIARAALTARTHADGTLEWYPPGRILVWLSGVGSALALIVLGVIEFAGIEADLHEQMGRVLATFAPDWPAEDTSALATRLVSLVPGAVGSAVTVLTIINGALAQTLVARLGKNIRPSPKMAEIFLPGAFVIAFGVVVAIGFLDGLPGKAATAVYQAMLVPIIMQGLAVVHAFIGMANAPGMLLVLFYFLLFLFSWLMPLFVVLGLVEQMAGLRRRFVTAGPGKEDEE